MDNDTRFIYRCWQFHCVRASAYQTTLSQIRHKGTCCRLRQALERLRNEMVTRGVA